jgi:integrase
MALEFSQQFEQSLSNTQGVRSDKIATTPLGVLIESSTRKDKKSFMNVLAKGDLLNATIRDINDNPDVKEKFGRFFEQEGKDKKTASGANKVLGSLKPFFEEAGYLAPKGRNPVRMVLSSVIGTTSSQELFPTDPIRKVPSPYPFETYTKLKEVVTGLLNSKNKAERVAGTQLAMHVIGGYRPSDFKNLRIENINFKNGVVSGLQVKDRGKTTEKAGYFPKIIRDILLKQIGDPTGKSGLVFPQNNEELINDALKKAKIPTEYTTAGKVKQGFFTLEDTRKLNETHLTSLGYDEKNPVRLAATLRANKTTIGQYVATGAGGRDIEELFVKTSTPHVAFTGTANHAQYLEDIGVKSSNIVKRYKVNNNVIDRFPLDRVEEFQTVYPTLAYEEGDKVITSTLSQVNKGNAKLYQEAVGSELAKRKDVADIAYAETAEEAEKARLRTQDIKKQVRFEKKASDLLELKNKGKNALDWITNNLGKPLKKGFIGALGVETARQFMQDPVGTGAAMASDLLLEKGLGTGPGAFASFALQSSRLNPDQVNSGEYTPLTGDQENLLQNMQNVAQSDTNIQTDETPRPQALNIIEQDTNIGNKIGTFGRTPDVSPGFVTPPSRSELADETQRQQNFMGVT